MYNEMRQLLAEDKVGQGAYSVNASRSAADAHLGYYGGMLPTALAAHLRHDEVVVGAGSLSV